MDTQNHSNSRWAPKLGGLQDLIGTYREGYTPASMMTPPIEQAYAHWLVREAYQGSGALVELGCFLGSLSRPLLNGLRENSAERAQSTALQVYDRFLWDSSMDEWTDKLKLKKRPADGESYEYLYEDFMQGYLDRLNIHTVDFIEEKPSTPNIEVLVVDVMKGFEIADNVAQAFFPKVIPGGVIVHQDYMTFAHGWIHLLTWRLRDYLRPVWLSKWSAMTSFEVISPIDEADCFTFRSFPPESPDEILEAFQWNKEVFASSEEVEIVLSAAEVFFLIMSHHGDTVGYEKYREAESKGWLEHQAFKDMVKYCR